MVPFHMFPISTIGFKYSVTENAGDFKIDMAGFNMPTNVNVFPGFVTTSFAAMKSFLVLFQQQRLN